MAFFDTPIEYLKGVGPLRASLLNKELKIFSFGDLIQYYPFRYEDRTKFFNISDLSDEMPNVLIKGEIIKKELVLAQKKRLVAILKDQTGEVELVWFQGINWVVNKIKVGAQYTVFGKPNRYGSKMSMAHPEIEFLITDNQPLKSFFPVYSITEKIRQKHIDSKALSKLMMELVHLASDKIRETLPQKIINEYKFLSKRDALIAIHFPENHDVLAKAQRRLKFEELFYIQLQLLKMKLIREDKFKGQVFDKADLVTLFYNSFLPFELTNAQKKVIKEIYKDLRSGKQMSRLLQGDVGSGKTIVAFICMLLVISGGAQTVLMAPTEILAQQHFNGLLPFVKKMNLQIELLTGSVKKSARKKIHEGLTTGTLNLLVGTHALIEEGVQFNNLGLAVIDEQHRFGVAQRSKLWQKNTTVFPHVLVMTATPIPRTLAMTLYGDLDVSIIDELPKGRKPIKTIHKYDSHRLQVNQFVRNEIASGRQVYFVYPLIDESEKLDLKHLMDGYESICRAFPEEAVSILHGKMKPDAKQFEMRRFSKGETKIMVATTVIEVGVDVPNASVMIIENAERFGLSQLHQLRGRVGRGAEQSYCILISDVKLISNSKTRIETMVRTNNGFEIAEADLQLRGPGDLMGTQQSGALELLIADLGKDTQLLEQARAAALDILKHDPDLKHPDNVTIREQIRAIKKTTVNWSRIS